MLRSLLSNLGCEVEDLGIVEDTLEATRAALRRAAACDLIVTSGGVSVGEEDHVKPAVEAEGRLEMWKIAIKPGKPLAFGRVGEAAAFIGLPGNPVSALVTFQMLVRPFILRSQGSSRWCHARTRSPQPSTGHAQTGGASSCVPGSTLKAGSSSIRTRVRGADLLRVGRRAGRQPAGHHDRGGRDGTLHPIFRTAVLTVMKLKVLYFASLREALGSAEELVEVPPELPALPRCAVFSPPGAGVPALAAGRNVRAAVNQQMVAGDAAIAEGDEIAFFPPVTGG